MTANHYQSALSSTKVMKRNGPPTTCAGCSKHGSNVMNGLGDNRIEPLNFSGDNILQEITGMTQSNQDCGSLRSGSGSGWSDWPQLG